MALRPIWALPSNAPASRPWVFAPPAGNHHDRAADRGARPLRPSGRARGAARCFGKDRPGRDRHGPRAQWFRQVHIAAGAAGHPEAGTWQHHPRAGAGHRLCAAEAAYRPDAAPDRAALPVVAASAWQSRNRGDAGPCRGARSGRPADGWPVRRAIPACAAGPRPVDAAGTADP
ncbi:UNVERIFIED_CONTAM: hypothetical protein NCL1_00354 [Trichonephila clavipes]